MLKCVIEVGLWKLDKFSLYTFNFFGFVFNLMNCIWNAMTVNKIDNLMKLKIVLFQYNRKFKDSHETQQLKTLGGTCVLYPNFQLHFKFQLSVDSHMGKSRWGLKEVAYWNPLDYSGLPSEGAQ